MVGRACYRSAPGKPRDFTGQMMVTTARIRISGHAWVSPYQNGDQDSRDGDADRQL
jgi:hypothetical protein